MVGWRITPIKGVEAAVPMPDGWVGGGEVALEETLVETARGEGEASPDGTGGDMATGPAADELGKNRVQSVNQTKYLCMYICTFV